MSNATETRTEIVHHMARAYFATAWADWTDEYGAGTSGNGMDVMDEMPPEYDPAAVWAAFKLANELEKQHGMHLSVIFTKAVEISEKNDAGDRPRNEEMFGHYAAMSAMGHGVGLWDALGSEADEFVDMPYGEFSYFEFDPKHYPIPGD